MASQSKSTVIRAGQLIDGVSPEPITDGVVVVRDGTVVAAGAKAAVDVPSDATFIDHSDQTVLPGLIDLHIHLQGERTFDNVTRVLERADIGLSAARATADLKRALEAGFTTIRDVGSTPGIGLQKAVAEGSIPGPRVYAAGRSLTQTGGKGDESEFPLEWIDGSELTRDELVDGVEECRKATRQRIRAGAKVIKIFATGGTLSKDAPNARQFTDDEIAAITHEAHKTNVPVAAHAQGAAGINACLRNGVDTIEHGDGLDDTGVELFHEHDATLVSTMCISDYFSKDEYIADLPTYAQEKTGDKKLLRRVNAIRTAYEQDVPIALGSDICGAGGMGFGHHAREAELLVEHVEMDEMDVIQSATSIAGATLPGETLGELTPGAVADIVVVDSNPLQDISALADVTAVYQDGQAVIGEI